MATVCRVCGRTVAGEGERARTHGAVFSTSTQERLDADPATAKKTKGCFQFNLTDGPGGEKASWHVDTRADTPKVSLRAVLRRAQHGALPLLPLLTALLPQVTEGAAPKADVTITIKDGDFVQLVEGKLNAQTAFMSGKIKIKGNMGLAMKMGSLTSGAAKSKL